MASIAQLAAKFFEAHFLVKGFGFGHPFQGFEVTGLVSQVLGFGNQGVDHL